MFLVYFLTLASVCFAPSGPAKESTEESLVSIAAAPVVLPEVHAVVHNLDTVLEHASAAAASAGQAASHVDAAQLALQAAANPNGPGREATDMSVATIGKETVTVQVKDPALEAIKRLEDKSRQAAEKARQAEEARAKGESSPLGCCRRRAPKPENG